MSTVVDFCDQKIVFIGQFINFDKLFESTISVSNELEELPLIYMQENEVHLIIIPYHAKIKIGEEVLGVWEILMKIRILESETGEKGKSAQSHICVLGNFPLEMVLRHEERAILLASHGVSYLRLPDKLDLDSIKEKIKDRSTPDNTRCYLTKLIDIRSLRHAYANIWGLDRLIQVHKKYYPDFIWEYPDVYKKQINTLNYQIAKYVFCFNKDDNDYKEKNTIEKLKELNKQLSKRPVLKVLLIEDNAEAGWLHLIESLILDRFNTYQVGTGRCLHNRRVLNMEIGDYDENLFDKFERKYNTNNGINVIVSDMRLYKEEEDVYEYKEFKSIELMKKISTHKVRADAADTYKATRYVLMTASNQLSNYRQAIKSNYAPSGIFIKEGFDYINSRNQKEEKYRDLIDVLINAIRDNYRKEPYQLGGGVETNSEYEEQKDIRFQKWISSNNWNNVKEKQSKVLNEYNYVLLDTNIYYSDKEYSVAWNESEKIKCLYPVYVEIEWRSGQHESSFRNYMADQFKDRLKNKIFKEYLDETDIKTIDTVRANAKVYKNFADPYFIKVIQGMYVADPGLRILFITNDRGPYDNVIKWIKENNIQTISVCTIEEFNERVKTKKITTIKSSCDNHSNRPDIKEKSITFEIKNDACNMTIPGYGKLSVSVEDWGGIFPKKNKMDKIIKRLIIQKEEDKESIIKKMKEIRNLLKW